jgi:hypothetical protein
MRSISKELWIPLNTYPVQIVHVELFLIAWYLLYRHIADKLIPVQPQAKLTLAISLIMKTNSSLYC